MRTIEPAGYVATVPPAQRSFALSGCARNNDVDLFYCLLRDALVARQQVCGELTGRRTRYHPGR